MSKAILDPNDEIDDTDEDEYEYCHEDELEICTCGNWCVDCLGLSWRDFL